MVHLQDSGFQIEDIVEVDRSALTRLRADAGIPRDAASCHTAFVDRFVIEGHVPGATIARLIEEDPPGVAGLVVPGMPAGSPGMESASPQPYTVFALHEDGSRTAFEEIP